MRCHFRYKKKYSITSFDFHNINRLFLSFSQNFLRDLLKEAKKINDVSEDKLIEYTDTMVRNVYKNINSIHSFLISLYVFHNINP